MPQNDWEKAQEIHHFYKKVQEQLLNIVVNNFDVPLAIFVNERNNRDMDYLNDSDEDGSHTSIPDTNAKQQVINA